MAPATSERIEKFKKAVSVLSSLNKGTSPKELDLTASLFANVEEELSELCQEALETPVIQRNDAWEKLCDCVKQSIKLFATLQEQANVGMFDLAVIKTPENLEQLRAADVTLNVITHLIKSDKTEPSMNEGGREHLVFELKAAVNLLKSLHKLLAQ